VQNRSGPDYKYDWNFTNVGKEDATNLRAKIATVDSTHSHHTLLTKTVDVLPRLKRGQLYPVTTVAENDLEFLVICLAYSNDSGTQFDDPPRFYITPFYKQANHEARSQPARVTAEQDAKLSAGFSCAKL
jgi:hypothetical protein